MKKPLLILILIVISLFQCSTKEQYKSISTKIDKEIIFADSLIDKTVWQNKDIISDSIPGISLDKAYKTILKKLKGNEIIVAILDTEIDISHKAFKNQIWVNDKDISNNNIDDDNNGYVDDINGWNFLGNVEGESVLVENSEYVRIVRKFRDQFETKKISDTLNINYKNYIRAKKTYEKELKYSKQYLKSTNLLMDSYFEARAALKDYFPDYKYSYEVLNTIDTINNGLNKHVKMIKSLLDYGDTDKNMTKVYKSIKDNYEKKLDITYFPRELVGDDLNNINDSIYGNNNLMHNIKDIDHGTRVTGMITNSLTQSKNDFNLKIMGINVVPNAGSTQDKDIALGIRYAVNNGAKVINMSFGKNFATNVEWLKDAFIYAEKHNVLIVSAVGNRGKNIDDELYIYPHDSYDKEPEFCDNFLYVGATSYNVNSNLIPYSDYGKINVDIFAPGENLYTTYPNNKYDYDSGTSLAAGLTSKVAALIFSYYPNLTASQVKHIIMDSGVEYTFPVKTPTKEDKNKMTPFNELSKSGKIVNAYNALIMADSVSKANKRKKD